MQKIWGILIIIGIIFSIITGRGEALSTAIVSSGEGAVSLILKLMGMLILWCGIMEIAKVSGLCQRVAKLISPIIAFIFKRAGRDERARELISMNIISNILGLGNAATPYGIAAMKRMKELTGDSLSRDMMLFTVMNTAALRLVPTTAITLREAAGAKNPADIIICVWVSSLLSLVAAMASVALFGGKNEC